MTARPTPTGGVNHTRSQSPEIESRVSSGVCQQALVGVMWGLVQRCSSQNCVLMCFCRAHKSHMEPLNVIWHWLWEGLDVPVIALISDFHFHPHNPKQLQPPLLMPLTGRQQRVSYSIWARTGSRTCAEQAAGVRYRTDYEKSPSWPLPHTNAHILCWHHGSWEM